MVITFLPYPDFQKSLASLDDKRLGKQRSEALILHRALQKDKSHSWTNHPATLMWEGYDNALALYLYFNIKEWQKRGFKNNMNYLRISDLPFVEFEDLKIELNLVQYKYIITGSYGEYEYEIHVHLPWWFNWDSFHYSHQASLVRKYPNFYTKIFTDLPDEYNHHGYIWPSKIDPFCDLNNLNIICAEINPDTFKNPNPDSVIKLKVLREKAKELGIKGVYKMNKEQLLNLFNKFNL